MKKIIALISFMGLVSCASGDVTTKDIEYVKDPLNPNRLVTKAEAERIGKLDLFGSSKIPDKEDFRLNKYLWDACLDVLADLPPLHIKPEVGIYQTDKVKVKDHTVSVQCRVTGEKIASKNLNVTVYEYNSSGESISHKKDSHIKGQILLRARELKINDV